MAGIVDDELRPSHSIETRAVERDVARQPLIDGDRASGVLDAGAVSGDSVWVEDVARAVCAAIRRNAEIRPVQRRRAAGKQRTNAARAGIPIEAGADRDGVAVLAIVTEVGRVARIWNQHARIGWVRHRWTDLAASGDRARNRRADRVSVVQTPGRMVKGQLRVEVCI